MKEKGKGKKLKTRMKELARLSVQSRNNRMMQDQLNEQQLNNNNHDVNQNEEHITEITMTKENEENKEENLEEPITMIKNSNYKQSCSETESFIFFDESFRPEDEQIHSINLSGFRIIDVSMLQNFLYIVTLQSISYNKSYKYFPVLETKIGLASSITFKCMCEKKFVLETSRSIGKGAYENIHESNFRSIVYKQWKLLYKHKLFIRYNENFRFK